MNKLLTRIKAYLGSDATLISTVKASNIMVEYAEKDAAYPHVAITGQETDERQFTNCAQCMVTFESWNKDNALKSFTIHDRIKVLMHKQERSITTSTVVVHACQRAGEAHGYYMPTTRTYRMTTQYRILSEDL